MGVAQIAPIVTAATQVDPQFWLNAAQAAVRRECGWHVAPIITEDLVLDGSGRRELLVPSTRIRRLVSVRNDSRDVTDEVRFSRRGGVLTLAGGWSCDVGSIEITMEHGYELDEVPDVAALIVTLTQRAAAAARNGPVASQAVGSANVKYLIGKDGGGLSVPLLQSEKDTLAFARLSWGA